MPDFSIFSFKTSFNAITNTYNALSWTEPVMNELKYETNQDTFLQFL